MTSDHVQFHYVDPSNFDNSVFVKGLSEAGKAGLAALGACIAGASGSAGNAPSKSSDNGLGGSAIMNLLSGSFERSPVAQDVAAVTPTKEVQAPAIPKGSYDVSITELRSFSPSSIGSGGGGQSIQMG